MLVHWCSYWVYSLGVFGCLAQDPKTTEKTDRVRPIGFDSEYGSIHPGWPRNCRDVSLQVHPCGKKKLMKKRPADSWRFPPTRGVFSSKGSLEGRGANVSSRRQVRMLEELRKRAEERRKKMEDQWVSQGWVGYDGLLNDLLFCICITLHN